jgi:hypothetical protein
LEVKQNHIHPKFNHGENIVSTRITKIGQIKVVGDGSLCCLFLFFAFFSLFLHLFDLGGKLLVLFALAVQVVEIEGIDDVLLFEDELLQDDKKLKNVVEQFNLQ